VRSKASKAVSSHRTPKNDGRFLMATEKRAPTAADYVAFAVSPALIMTLVGSLVWFLVTVCYQGDFVWRLRWILSFFVFAAVLIARISMRGDISARAWVYGIALAIPTWLGMQFFVDYPEESGLRPWTWALNILFLAIVWWCAHRLTKDCTLLEDEEEDGEG